MKSTNRTLMKLALFCRKIGDTLASIFRCRVVGMLIFFLLSFNVAIAQKMVDTDVSRELPSDSITDGTVTVEGNIISYRAIAGQITVGSTDTQDIAINSNKPDGQSAVAQMFYASYFRKDVERGIRPITFIYNGGPGSASAQLHMMAFGPMRVVTSEPGHTQSAPYKLVNNEYSLLDVSDLVFIDAPGTGFSRVAGPDAAKAFWGVDEDAHAFERFIRHFLTKYELWNAPKYLLSESYGTTRSAVLSRILEDHDVDLNGVLQLSQNLSFDDSPDGPQYNPGTDEPYYLALPAMTAAAWYHHTLPKRPDELEPLLREVEKFSLSEYATALIQGADLPEQMKDELAGKLYAYTGIPKAYWINANLRLNGPAFRKELLSQQGLTIGRLDTRYQGADLDPLSGIANYDPFMTTNSPEFTSVVNLYLRKNLKYGQMMTYKANARDGLTWNWTHIHPGQDRALSINVIPDLAMAMIRNPRMRVMIMGGYFDLSGCTYFASLYQMKHLPIPISLEGNIIYHFFNSGHMIYSSEKNLKQLHRYIANFIADDAQQDK